MFVSIGVLLFPALFYTTSAIAAPQGPVVDLGYERYIGATNKTLGLKIFKGYAYEVPLPCL